MPHACKDLDTRYALRPQLRHLTGPVPARRRVGFCA
jgi:hypothetical protein